MPITRRLLAALKLSILLSMSSLAWSAALPPSNSPPLFNEHTPIDIRLSADWGKLLVNVNSDSKRYPATLTIGAGTSEEQVLNVEVRPRGNSRRRKENCAFPPLALKFDAEEVAGTVFAAQSKLKLVTHCTTLGRHKSVYSDRLHSEYLLYRIYNLITPLSFNVRQVNIAYSYPGRSKSTVHPGFIIEHKSAIARRTGSEIVKQPRITKAELDPRQTSLANFFAYFAGNTDFNFRLGPKEKDCCHNAIALADETNIIPVPYDFDISGFVDPPYAKPSEKLKIRNVSQRLYRGFCAHQEGVSFAAETFMQQRATIEDLLATYPAISEARRKKLQRYTKKFFTTLSNPDQFQQNITDACR